MCNGNTTPVARSSFTGSLEIVQLLIEKGANFEIPTLNGNTALMWAAYAGCSSIVEFLLSKGASVNHYNRDGLNALDLTISRMHYPSALLVYKKGMKLRTIEEYKKIIRIEYDIDKFLECLKEERIVDDPSEFFLPGSNFNKFLEVAIDMVIDTRETWKEFFSRVWNFKSAPMVERSELPPKYQPHKSLYGKFTCWTHGINPYPPSNSTSEIIADSRDLKDFDAIYQPVIEKDKEKTTIAIEEEKNDAK